MSHRHTKQDQSVAKVDQAALDLPNQSTVPPSPIQVKKQTCVSLQRGLGGGVEEDSVCVFINTRGQHRVSSSCFLLENQLLNGYSVLDFMYLLFIDLPLFFCHDTFVMNLGEVTPDLWPTSGRQGEGMRGGVRSRVNPRQEQGPCTLEWRLGAQCPQRRGFLCQRKAAFGRPRVRVRQHLATSTGVGQRRSKARAGKANPESGRAAPSCQLLTHFPI